jgi:hypothetical protein
LFGTLYFLLALLSSSLVGIDEGVAVFVTTVISHIELLAFEDHNNNGTNCLRFRKTIGL